MAGVCASTGHVLLTFAWGEFMCDRFRPEEESGRRLRGPVHARKGLRPSEPVSGVLGTWEDHVDRRPHLARSARHEYWSAAGRVAWGGGRNSPGRPVRPLRNPDLVGASEERT